MRSLFTITSVLAMAAASSAVGQGQASEEQAKSGEQAIRVLSDWSYEPLYSEGWSVEWLFDETEVDGLDGEEIGGVENLIIADSGEVLSVIAEVGGFWDIGDTHVAVPWDEVEIAAGAESMTIPVDEDNVGDYSIFGDAGVGWYDEEEAGEVTEVNDDLVAGAGVIKATDLIGDYAYLTGGERYGYVSDLVIMDGRVSAVVVDASAYGTPGYYAYPYPGYVGYGTGGYRYDLPYAAEDIAIIETFEYDEMQGGSAGERESGEAEQTETAADAGAAAEEQTATE